MYHTLQQLQVHLLQLKQLNLQKIINLNQNVFRTFQLTKSFIYLAQTDTTVGFLSNDDKKLNSIKNRPKNKEVLSVVNSFKTLKKHTRIPNKYKKLIRNSNKTSFIYANKKSFRVVNKNSIHYNFINKFEIIYSTSANLTNEKFDFDFAYDKSDVIVYNNSKFIESHSSKIFKISNYSIKKIR